LFCNLANFLAPDWTSQQLIRRFATPPRPRLRAKETRFLATARTDPHTLADLGGLVYHWGDPDRPYVLLSYGWAYNAGRWRHFVPGLLAAGYRVIAYDPPGHGQAPAGQLTLPGNIALIRRLLTTFGPARAVIAHSFGGGSSVAALSTLDTAYHPSRLVLMASFSKATWIFRHYQYLLGLTERTYQQMVRRLEARIDGPLHQFDLARKSSRLTATRALIVHDPADTITHYRNARRYHAYWPESALWSPDGAGHHLGTQAITNGILDFVRRGILPPEAVVNRSPLPADHDLVRFFAGLETGEVLRPVTVP
jgi:pimeloyl-ACP methyl ester carboxylesterase